MELPQDGTDAKQARACGALVSDLTPEDARKVGDPDADSLLTKAAPPDFGCVDWYRYS
jgi:hypothetical protein